MKTLTKQNIDQLVKEIIIFLEKEGIADSVSIYFNNKVMRSQRNDDGYNWVSEKNVDPHDYFEYAAYDHILSMSFEGGLYDMLNYSFGRKEEGFNAIFEEHGLYYEFGDSWNLSVYPIDDDMEIEYTKYERPKETIVLHQGDYIPSQLKNIMDIWWDLSKRTGDRGSCVLGSGFNFEWNDDKYFMPAQSPYQGSISWEEHIDVVKQALENIGATEIYYNWGRMD